MAKISILAILFFLCVFSLQAQDETLLEISLNARLHSEEVPLNKEVHLTVTANWIGPPNTVTFLPIDTPTTTNLKVVSTTTSNVVGTKDGNVTTTKKYEFYFIGETLGMAYIDEVILRYQDVNLDEYVLRTARLPLKIVDPVAREGEMNLMMIFTTGAIVILLGGGVFYLWKKRATQKDAQEVVIEKSPEQVAVDTLKTEVEPNSTNLQAQYAVIDRVIREFFKARYGFSTGQKSMEDVLGALEDSGDSMEDRAVVKEILQACDVAKFSGGTTDAAHFNRIYTNACQYFEKHLSQNENSNDLKT